MTITAGRLLFACTLAGLLAGTDARADSSRPAGDQPESPAFVLRGFGTIGVVRSSSDQAEFIRDLSQPGGVAGRWTAKTDSLLGLQGNFRISERIEGVAQVVTRYGNEGSFEPEVMWAFAKFDPNAHLSLRAGRLGTDFLMLADSRLVGYSYLPVRPPGDYFGTLPFQHIDGVDGAATAETGNGLLRGKLFSGVLDGEVPSVGKQWNLRGSRMSGGNIDYQAGDWLWRLGYAQLRFKNNIPNEELLDTLAAGAALGLTGSAAVADALSAGGKWSRFYSAGIVYDRGPLLVQLMLSRIRQESAVFEDTRAGYTIASYRVGHWTPFAGYSQAKSTTRQLPATGMGPVMDATIAYLQSRAHTDQSTAFVGVRWDFAANMALKAQFDAIRGSAASIFPYQRPTPEWNGRTNVLSVALDFVF